MTDTDAVALVQQGSAEAFMVLYNRHQPVVRGRCSKAFQNEHDAEDLTQDIFLKVWSKIKFFKSDCAFATWLYTMTTNQIRDRMRCKHFRLMDDVEIPDTPCSPPQLLRVQLNDALRGLSKEDSRYLEASVIGFGSSEIARRSMKTKSRVHKHLQAARAQIRGEVG